MASSIKLSPVMLRVGRSPAAQSPSSKPSPASLPPLAAAASCAGSSSLAGVVYSGTQRVCRNATSKVSTSLPHAVCSEVSNNTSINVQPPADLLSNSATAPLPCTSGVRQIAPLVGLPLPGTSDSTALPSSHLQHVPRVDVGLPSTSTSILHSVAAGLQCPPNFRRNVYFSDASLSRPAPAGVGECSEQVVVLPLSPDAHASTTCANSRPCTPTVRQNVAVDMHQSPIPVQGSEPGNCDLQPIQPIPGPSLQPTKSFAAVVRGTGFVRKHASTFVDFGKVPDLHIDIGYSSKDGCPAIIFEEDVEARTEALFNQAIVIKFLNGRPPLEICHSVISSSWGLQGQFAMGLLDSRTLLIRLELLSDVVVALSIEESKIKNFSFKVYRWNASFSGRLDESTAPVWLSLPKLPINCFVPSILKAIGNGIGKFLRVDLPTSSLTRPSAARLCVEVNLKEALPKKIWIGMYGGFWQSIDYGGIPSFCSSCFRQGHSTVACRSQSSLGKHQQASVGGLEAPIEPHPSASATVSIDGPVLAVHDSTIVAAAESMSPTFTAPAAPVLGGAAARVPVCTAFVGPEVTQSRQNRFSVLAVQQENVPTAAGRGCVQFVDRQVPIPPDSVSIPFARPDLQAVQSTSAVPYSSVCLRPVSASAAADVLAGPTLPQVGVQQPAGPVSSVSQPQSAAIAEQSAAVFPHVDGGDFGVSKVCTEPFPIGSAADGTDGLVSYQSGSVSDAVSPGSAAVPAAVSAVSAGSALSLSTAPDVRRVGSVLNASAVPFPAVIALAAPALGEAAIREPTSQVSGSRFGAGKFPAASKMRTDRSLLGYSLPRSSSWTSASDEDVLNKGKGISNDNHYVDGNVEYDKLMRDFGIRRQSSNATKINETNFSEEDFDIYDSLYMTDEDAFIDKPKINKRHPTGPLRVKLRNRRR